MSKKLAYTLLVTALAGGVSAPASAAPATAGSAGSSPPASETVAAPVAADLAPADAPSANPSEPAPLLRHDPIDSAKANEPLLIVAHWAAPSRTPPQVFLHYRRAGQSVFHTTPLGIRDTTTLEATIPAADLLSGTIEYYLGSKPHADSAAPEQLHFGSPQWPHAVAVVVDGSERTQRALLAQHLGDRSQFQVSGMYIDRGLRTVLNKSRTAQFDMRDYYYRLEGDYTYRILSVVHSIRIGGGVIRGGSGTVGCATGVCCPVRRRVALKRIRHGQVHQEVVGAGDGPHGDAVSGADIGGEACTTAQQALDRAHVRIDQIEDMDVVAQACAVARVVILTENPEGFATTEEREKRERNGVAFGIMAFADTLIPRRAGGIEVAQMRERSASRDRCRLA